MNVIHYGVRRSALAYEVFGSLRDAFQRRMWRARSRLAPPPGVVKRELIRTLARRYRIHVFVETGTFLGDTVWTLRSVFESVHSIELNPQLHAFAHRRLRGSPHVCLYQGDSPDVLAALLPTLADRCLFWLDGHYSGGDTARGLEDSPVRRELDLILSHPIGGHVILIDDARCFQGAAGYPTLAEVRDLVAVRRPDTRMTVADDIIQIEPAGMSTGG